MSVNRPWRVVFDSPHGGNVVTTCSTKRRALQAANRLMERYRFIESIQKCGYRLTVEDRNGSEHPVDIHNFFNCRCNVVVHCCPHCGNDPRYSPEENA